MVFQNTHFFLVIKMNKLEHVGLNCSILLRYLLIDLLGQSNILSLSPSTKATKDGTVNPSKHKLYTEGFWVLATKSGTKEKVQDLQPFEYLMQQERPHSSLTLLVKVKARREQVFQIRCLSEGNFTASYG